jgi:hypothetical protein
MPDRRDRQDACVTSVCVRRRGERGLCLGFVEAFVSNACLVLTGTSTAAEGDSEISVSAVIAV